MRRYGGLLRALAPRRNTSRFSGRLIERSVPPTSRSRSRLAYVGIPRLRVRWASAMGVVYRLFPRVSTQRDPALWEGHDEGIREAARQPLLRGDL
jgi:hypothetical protein